MRHISELVPGVLDRLRPNSGAEVVIDFAAVRAARGLEPRIDSECARQCRCILRAFRHVTSAYADGRASAYRRAARRIKAIHDLELKEPILLDVVAALMAHAETEGGPVPSPELTVTKTHDVGGQAVITMDLGGKWYWQLDRRVPRTEPHGPFDTEDDAVSDAIGELIYGEPS